MIAELSSSTAPADIARTGACVRLSHSPDYTKRDPQPFAVSRRYNGLGAVESVNCSSLVYEFDDAADGRASTVDRSHNRSCRSFGCAVALSVFDAVEAETRHPCQCIMFTLAAYLQPIPGPDVGVKVGELSDATSYERRRARSRETSAKRVDPSSAVGPAVAYGTLSKQLGAVHLPD